MAVSYDVFGDAFLQKVTDYDIAVIDDYDRNMIVDGCMKRAIAQFKKICKYDFSKTGDDVIREFNVEVADGDMDELADIISEGMVVQWLKPYTFKQDNLQQFLNTRDFSSYSPAEMLNRISGIYKSSERAFTRMMKEYSYNHGDLTVLNL